jgi:ABC-type Fe3+ transport system permease subunit
MAVVLVIVAILFCLIPIAVLALIIGAILKKKDATQNGSEKRNFESAIRAIYIYLVLICALCAIIGGIISTFNYGLDVLLPEESYNTTNSDLQDRNENIVQFATNISIFIVAIPIFIYHSKIAKKANKESENEEISIDTEKN